MKLYKYRSLDNLWRILEIIIDKKFYVAHWQELNDPMEDRYYLFEDIVNIFMEFCQINGNEEVVLDKENKIDQFFKDLSHIKNEKTTRGEGLQGAHKNRFNRILSFSEDPLNYLMWSHYGDSHKGIVIEVDFPDEISKIDPFKLYLKHKFCFTNVIYKKNINAKSTEYYKRLFRRTKKQNIHDACCNKIIYNLYRQKLDLWDYEKEARFICGNKKYLNLDEFNAKITKILIGCKIDSQKESILRSIIGDIPIDKVEYKNGSLGIRLESGN